MGKELQKVKRIRIPKKSDNIEDQSFVKDIALNCIQYIKECTT